MKLHKNSEIWRSSKEIRIINSSLMNLLNGKEFFFSLREREFNTQLMNSQNSFVLPHSYILTLNKVLQLSLLQTIMVCKKTGREKNILQDIMV